MQFGAQSNEVAGLRDRIQVLEAENADLRQQLRYAFQSAPATPYGSRITSSHSTGHLAGHYKSMEPETPTHQPGHSRSSWTTEVAPISLQSSREVANRPRMTSRGHMRAETPLISKVHLGPLPDGGVSLNNSPPFPEKQEYRSLLLEFYEQVQRWTARHIQNATVTSPESAYRDFAAALVRYMPGATNAVQDLAKDLMHRHSLAAAILTRYMLNETMSQDFFKAHDSERHARMATLTKRWNDTTTEASNVPIRRTILEEQKMLYREMRNSNGYRDWRFARANSMADEMMQIFSPLVPHDERDSGFKVLIEFMLKSLRIAERMRTDLCEWSITFPQTDTDFRNDTMVNGSVLLMGDQGTTNRETLMNPGRFKVMFSVTPFIKMRDFSGGRNDETFVHKSIVHLKFKDA